MLALNCKIIIGNIELYFSNDIAIEKSVNSILQTCNIRLPKSIRLQDQDILNLIGKGERVEVWMGYNADLKKEFSGFVTATEPSVPFSIHCENEAWLLKQATVSNSWRNPSLQDIIAAMAPNTPAIVADVRFGSFRIDRASPYTVLEGLREKFGIKSFFMYGMLYVGTEPTPQTVSYGFQQNIVSHSLTWKTRDEFNFGVRAISILPNNQTYEYTAGSSSGNLKTIAYYNISEAELKKRAEALLANRLYDGYDGEITTFGLPYCQPSDVADLHDSEYPTRSGKYIIEKTSVLFGQGGFRRTLTIGQRI